MRKSIIGGGSHVRPDAAIYDLDWNETSGADHPANEEEGWLVMKSREVNGLLAEAEALLKSTDGAQGTDPAGRGGGQSNVSNQMMQQHQQLHQQMDEGSTIGASDIQQDLEQYDWSSAPQDVRRAVRLVIAHIAADAEDEQSRNGGESGDGSTPQGASGSGASGKTPATKTTDLEDASGIRKALKKLVKKFSSLEDGDPGFDDGMDDWSEAEEMELMQKSISSAWPNLSTKLLVVRDVDASDIVKAAMIDVAVGELAEEAGNIFKAARVFSKDRRSELAKKGNALPDGSYPMPDCNAVGRAVQAFGRAPESHRAPLKALIKSRAGALDCKNLIPDSWD